MPASRTDPIPPPLRLHLLGPFEVFLGDRPLPRLRSRKSLWLLALLTLRRGADVERDWLAGLLWPDHADRQALRNGLAELRRALGPEAARLLSPTFRTLSLDLSGVVVDVLAFDAATARGDPDSLAEAVGLYRGPLLEGCTEEWVFQEREAREQAYLTSLEKLAAQALAGREWATAEEHLRRAAAVDPLRESVHRGLMQARASTGNYASALLCYRELRHRLHRELNTGPDPETTALFQQLRAEARGRAQPKPPTTTPALSPPHNLPLQLTSFIGRGQQMAEIEGRLEEHRLLTLTGAGGCGKTRLVVEVASGLLERYPHGVWLVEFAALSDPALVPPTVASAVGVREEPGRPLTATLAEDLRPKSLLLLLDNCEHLLTGCAQLADALLRSCPSLRILATSREALGIVGEQTYRVPSLSTPDARHLPPLEDLNGFEAVRLFAERARLSQSSFAVTPANAAAVVEVCERLDGIPLAIELAAARVSVLTVEQIATRLDDRLRLLTGGSRTALPRQQTLRATIDWSHGLLAEEERVLLRRLCVFAGGFTLKAAEAVCVFNVGGREGDQPQAPLSRADPAPLRHSEEVLDLLSRLVDKSLVVAEEQRGTARYRLLETIRQYGWERLLEADEGARSRDQHREWCLTLAEEAEPHLQVAAERASWLERLEIEHDNLRAALAWSIACEHPESGLRLVGALGRFWRMRGYWTEGRERLTALLALPGAKAHAAARAKALQGTRWLPFNQGDWQAARALFEESLAIERELGDMRSAGNSLLGLAWVAHRQRNAEAARALSEEGLAIFRELGDKAGIVDPLLIVGNLTHHQGEYGTARALYEESLATARETGNKYGIAWSLCGLGNVTGAQGEYGAARMLYEESVAVFRELGEKADILDPINALGDLARAQGEYGTARAYFEESLAICREQGNKHGITRALSRLGRLALSQGEPEAARPLFQECLVIERGLGNKLAISIILERLATVAVAQGQLDRAARLFGAAEVLGEVIGRRLPPAGRAEHHRSVADVRTALGETAFALAWGEGRVVAPDEAVAYALEEPGGT